jgi:hypothetical protein
MSKCFYDTSTGAATEALVSCSLAIDERGEHEDLRDSDHRSVIPYIHGRTGLYCSSMSCLCEPEPYLLFLPISFFSIVKWRLPEPFIALIQAVTMSLKVRQVALGQVKPYDVGYNG